LNTSVCHAHQTSLLNWRAVVLAMAMGLAVLTAPWAPAVGATSGAQDSPAVAVDLITAENWIAPGASSISAGLSISLSDGWKTYWRSPGEVGLPPEMDFSSSDNVAGIEILWPAPYRFTAFGIQNFGYAGEVVLPVRIALERPGEATNLRADVNLLVCSDVCVPTRFSFAIDLPTNTPEATGFIDQTSAAQIATFVARVPQDGPSEFASGVAAFVDQAEQTLTLTAQSSGAFNAPDVFPEMGDYTAFGPPDIRLGDGGRLLWAQFPILTLDESSLNPVITITDGDRSATLQATPLSAAPRAPFAILRAGTSVSSLAWIALVAMLGGLILNVMPCVLPVLSIKLASVVSGGGKSLGAIRTSFLASAFGILAFMWMLAAITFGLRQLGVTVGWGLQFQNPAFLALMVVILAIFAANMLGLFEISLPSGLQTRLARSGAKGGYAGDFATGAFAAVLATPCSAPFLGTAIAFALTGGAVDIAVVFTGLGVGLALPYFAIAIYPRAAQFMPKPGRWMVVLKAVLGLLLLLTTVWLIWVMSGVAGQTASLAAIGLTLALIGLISLWRSPSVAKWVGVGVLAIAPIVAAAQLAEQTAPADAAIQTEWAEFDRAQIARHVSRGEVVFVDVTADWCLTCQANKIWCWIANRSPGRWPLTG